MSNNKITFALTLAFLAFIGAKSAAQLQFVGPWSTTSVGNEPSGLILADLNADGVQDFACCNRQSNTVSVRLGNGNGGFTGTANYTVGSFPQEVVASDLNGDGKVDLLVSNRVSNTLSILLNNGNGTFAAALTRNTQSLPRSIAMRDFDGDGRRDAIVVCEGSDVIEIRPNGSGTGVLQPTQILPTTLAFTLSTASTPDQVTTADVDNDGDRDIIVTHNSAPGRIKVFKYVGGGSLGASDFQAQSAQIFGQHLRGIRAAHFNGDTMADLAVVDWSLPSGAVHVLAGNGNGTFSLATSTMLGARALDLDVLDFDGDGNQDCAVTVENNDCVTVLRGDGQGGFSEQTCVGTTSTPIKVEAGDLNGDNMADLLVTTRGSDNVKAFIRRQSLLTTNHRPWNPDVHGTLDITLDAGPTYAGQFYVLGLSLLGFEMVTPIGQVAVPLEYDLIVFMQTMPGFSSFTGLLNANGQGVAHINPANYNVPPLTGITLWIGGAWGTLGSSGLTLSASATTIPLPLQ